MGNVTAKQVKKSMTKVGRAPDLKARVGEYKEELLSLSSALDVYRIASFDIEASHLKADFGFMLSACIKPAGQPPQTFRIDSYPGYRKKMWDDSKLIRDVAQALQEFDLVVTWNGTDYDFPFLDGRLVLNGQKRASMVHHIDLLPVARRGLVLHSYRQEAVATALGIPDAKTPLKPITWQKASHGDKESLDYIVTHCQKDVATLETIFVHLKPFVDRIYRRR